MSSWNISRNMGALRISEMGSKAFDNFFRSAAEPHLPPGQSEISPRRFWSRKGDADGRYGRRIPTPASHRQQPTTMINGLGVARLGRGAGIEAESRDGLASVSMLIPKWFGFKLTGKLAEGITATDLVETDPCVADCFAPCRVVGSFLRILRHRPERNWSLADRATIRQYGAGIWRELRAIPPIRRKDAGYLELTGRSAPDRVR